MKSLINSLWECSDLHFYMDKTFFVSETSVYNLIFFKQIGLNLNILIAVGSHFISNELNLLMANTLV